MTVSPWRTDIEVTPRKTNVDAVLEAESLLRSAKVTEAPRLEAEALLADLLGIERARLIASYPEPIENPDAYLSLIRRRIAGEPFAHITGKKEFMGFTFCVDRSTLIPRPETETLVECVLGAIGKDAAPTVLDIGTGSGCVAISLALIMPCSSLHATDIGPEPLARAQYNAKNHGVNHRIVFHAGDIYSALPDSLKGRADAIVSNPPYISDAEYSALDASIRKFEPPAALRGGRDGLDVFRKIVAGAPDFLARDGILAIEIGANQAEAAADIFTQNGSFSKIQTVPDLAGRPRVIMGEKRL
jgi:release factor glutamine methyltransferase